jgi:hypothetical protein
MNEHTTPWKIKDAAGNTIGIGVPVIDKALYFEDVPKNDKEMNWFDATKHAKMLGRALPSKKELYILAYFKDEINELAAEAGHPDFLHGWAWSSTEYSTNNAWYVSFGSGSVSNGYKYYTSIVVRPVAAL